MALKEEFVKTGNWLFRWRSYLPLLMIGMLLIAVREFEHLGQSEILDDFWEMFCLTVSFFGLGIRIYTIGHRPKGTSGRSTRHLKAATLNTTGIYSLVRHPLYLGNFFMWLGISLFVHLWWLTLICILIFGFYYERIMFSEEEFLRNKFGKQYEEWAENTPAFVPNLRGWKQPSLPFSIRTVLKKEYHGFFAIIVIFTLLEVVGDLFYEGKLELDSMWRIIFAAGLLVWLTLRILEKKTNILSDEGR